MSDPVIKGLNDLLFAAWEGKPVSSQEFMVEWERLSLEDQLAIYRRDNRAGKDIVNFWAPAGNQSRRAQVIVSGFSTSVQAGQYITERIEAEIVRCDSLKDIAPLLRDICIKSVYRGTMLQRLAWGLSLILPILSVLAKYPLMDIVASQWTNIKELGGEREEVGNNENRQAQGEGPVFKGMVDSQLILTQVTLHGLAVDEQVGGRNGFTCAAHKIPLTNARGMAESYLRHLRENKNTRFIFVLGNQASKVWSQVLRNTKNASVKCLLNKWWTSGENPSFSNNVQYIIKLPHPSPGNPTYVDNINAIVNRLESCKSKV